MTLSIEAAVAIDTAIAEARAQAIGYVWGRQDMGEAGDTIRSLAFGDAYAERKRAYLAEETCFMPNIRSAYGEWDQTGTIALR
jgi:hypothetical protein